MDADWHSVPMGPEEPIAPWFDDVFERLGEGRSTTLRRRLDSARSPLPG